VNCRLEWRRKNQTKDATLEGVDRVVSYLPSSLMHAGPGCPKRLCPAAVLAHRILYVTSCSIHVLLGIWGFVPHGVLMVLSSKLFTALTPPKASHYHTAMIAVMHTPLPEEAIKSEPT
jgi:hypothetical protein